MGETHVQTVARLARLSVTDVVRQDNEILRGIEHLLGSKQNSGKSRRKELAARLPGVMQKKHCIGYRAINIFARTSQGVVMQLHFCHPLARFELEVLYHKVVLGRRGIVGCAS